VNHTEWVIVIVGGVLWLTLYQMARTLDGVKRQLEIIVGELVFANQDKREIERRERWPDLPY
jgi:hypothetical protein